VHSRAFLVFLILIAIGALFKATIRTKSSRPKTRTGGTTPKRALTPTDTLMFARLSEALPNHQILAQVQLIRYIDGRTASDKLRLFNTYGRMSSDFLICNEQFDVLAAVELDDKTHARPDRIKADTKKEAILKDAGIPLIRWHAEAIPKGPEIRERFALTQVLAPKGAKSIGTPPKLSD
jgi:very-short-patch-repair endonuclease